MGSVALAKQCNALYLVSNYSQWIEDEAVYPSQIKISNQMLARMCPTSKTQIVRGEKNNE